MDYKIQLYDNKKIIFNDPKYRVLEDFINVDINTDFAINYILKAIDNKSETIGFDAYTCEFFKDEVLIYNEYDDTNGIRISIGTLKEIMVELNKQYFKVNRSGSNT